MTREASPVAAPSVPRRAIVRSLVRALASMVVVLLLYFFAPLSVLADVPVGFSLSVALLLLLAVTAWQVAAITRNPFPGLRAIEALAVTVPVFLLLFAASYVILSQGDPASFSVSALDKTDALYFTITTFVTVGYGDITATSPIARRIVTGQMVLDLLILGFGIRVFTGAVQRARHRDTTDPAPR